MKIEIKHKDTGTVIRTGEYDSIKDYLVQNRDADLRGADLGGADLRGADLGGADLGGADLRGADLRDAYLRYAYLGYADLRGADLRGADLRGAKNYTDSHDIFQEVVRRQPSTVFSTPEWSAIAQITIYRLCWDSIKKRFPTVMPHIFWVLADAGFNEWLDFWSNLKEKEVDKI